jgi:hypothetical protein
MKPRKPILLALAVASMIVLLAAFAIAGAWPFQSPSNDSERHALWETKVALQETALYALDVLPVIPHAACSRCMAIKTDAQGRVLFSAENGIQGWPKQGEPSYVDCILLRNKTTLDSVVLGARRTTLEGVAEGGWICATGGADDGLLRMRYEGRKDGRFLFRLASWGRPAEG